MLDGNSATAVDHAVEINVLKAEPLEFGVGRPNEVGLVAFLERLGPGPLVEEFDHAAGADVAGRVALRSGDFLGKGPAGGEREIMERLRIGDGGSAGWADEEGNGRGRAADDGVGASVAGEAGTRAGDLRPRRNRGD